MIKHSRSLFNSLPPPILRSEPNLAHEATGFVGVVIAGPKPVPLGSMLIEFPETNREE